MNYSTLEWKLEGAIGTITLSRPEKRNAISAQMVADIMAVLAEAEASAAGVVIVTGSGKAFCAGMDIDELRSMATQMPGDHLEDSQRLARFFRRLYTFPKPLIAAVNGPAIAGGCGIATMADFTLAAPEAKFGYTEVRIGFLPALVSVFVKRQIGAKAARDLLLTGKIVDAAEAFRIGLVTEIVPSADLLARARQIAETLLAVSPSAVIRTKKLLLECEQAALDADLALAIRENAAIRATADFTEGVTSFLEKRPPKWTGR